MPNAIKTIVLGASLWALWAASAAAALDQSILDAYSGQAAVLGKPTQVHRGGASLGAKLSPNPPSGGSQAGTQAANSATGTSSAATGALAQPRARGAAGAVSGARPLVQHTGAPSASAVSSSAAPSMGVSGLQGSSASLPFNWADALALAAGGVALALVAAGLRRLVRTSV